MRKRTFWIAAALLTLLLAIVPLALHRHSLNNTLLQNGRWFTMKSKLAAPPFGTNELLTGTQVLAGNVLNFHAWHAHQEYVLRDSQLPRSIFFDFRVAPSGYVLVEFDKTFDGFQAFRLSASELAPSAALRVDGEGGFLEKTLLPEAQVAPAQWHRAEVRLTDTTAQLVLNGTALAPVARLRVEDGWVAFRGGHHPARADNVRVVTETGRVIRDRFDGYERLPLRLFRYTSYALPLSVLVWAVLWLFMRDTDQALGMLVSLHLCAAAGCFTLYLFQQQIQSRLYPVVDEGVQESEREWVSEHAEAVTQEHAAELSEEKAPGQLRVMFLGTSQTWGEGALVIEDRFVERIARALDGRASIAPVEVVNLGVCGAVSRQLLHYYRESWIEYAPDLVVLNLSVNDGEQDDFAANLRAFVELNRERGIETLFSLEATDIENSSGAFLSHHAMQEVARELGVPCVDTRACVNEQVDTGIIWWDVVHPTSYGHGLIAECLLPEVESMLRARRAAAGGA